MGWKELRPKTLQSQREQDKYLKNDNSLVASLKREYCCCWLVVFFFPFKTTHILKGEGAGEIQPPSL